MSDLPEHVRRNRAFWDEKALEFVESGEEGWKRDTPAWGIWQIRESQVRMLPDSVADKDVIELGCGTAYVSAWLARRGARVVGIDNSAAQLATAQRLQHKYGLEFPLIHGNAESIDYPDASFDFAISEYGACLWADPQRPSKTRRRESRPFLSEQGPVRANYLRWSARRPRRRKPPDLSPLSVLLPVQKRVSHASESSQDVPLTGSIPDPGI
jgi:SAM-dependent methyltransferase